MANTPSERLHALYRQQLSRDDRFVRLEAVFDLGRGFSNEHWAICELVETLQRDMSSEVCFAAAVALASAYDKPHVAAEIQRVFDSLREIAFFSTTGANPTLRVLYPSLIVGDRQILDQVCLQDFGSGDGTVLSHVWQLLDAAKARDLQRCADEIAYFEYLDKGRDDDLLQRIEAKFPAFSAWVKVILRAGKKQRKSRWKFWARSKMDFLNRLFRQSEEKDEALKAVLKSFEELLKVHLSRLKGQYAKEQEFLLMKGRWDNLLHPDILAFTVNAIDQELRKSIQDSQHHYQDRRFSGIYVVVSTIPTVALSRARASFPGGYIGFLDFLLAKSRHNAGGCDLAHWLFTFGEQKKIHLSFLPARELAEAGITVFAQDLMTEAEKRRVGLV